MIVNLAKFATWAAVVASPVYALYLFALSAGL